ncbi:3'-5' exonuclease [Colletotrichum graminicola]|nr:3'-5' exonuclease [Colletotrichum graminicola]
MATPVLQHVKITEMSTFPAYNLIDTSEAISDLVDSFDNLSGGVPALYIDLEGENLCREGTVSIMQIYVSPKEHAYIIDV